MAYARSGNATEAYMGAGYTVKSDKTAGVNASRLLGNARVQARLQEIRDKIASEAIMQPKEMQERLSAIARMEATESVRTMDGSEVQRKAGFKAALKAMELLGKMQGAFLDRKEVEMKGVVPVVLKDDI